MYSNLKQLTFDIASQFFSTLNDELHKTIDSYRVSYKCNSSKSLSAINMIQLMNTLKKLRLLINTVHADCELFNKLDENKKKKITSEIKLNLNKYCISNIFSNRSRSIQEELKKKLIVTPDQFIKKCIYNIIPKTSSENRIGFQLKERKVLEIDKEAKNRVMLTQSIKLLKKSRFHENSYVRNYVSNLLKTLNKDFNKEKITRCQFK